MTNREIAKHFNKLAKLMELHGENQFRTRTYSNAYLTIRKLPFEAYGKSTAELEEVKGIGKSIAQKIIEVQENGSIVTLNEYLEKTPKGIVQLLDMKGFGPKKILTVWKEMGIESPGELLYACNENRLVELKGFGAKSQATLMKQLEYFLASQGKYLYGHTVDAAQSLLQLLQEAFPKERFELTGNYNRKMPEIEGIDILTTADLSKVNEATMTSEHYEAVDKRHSYMGVLVTLTGSTTKDFEVDRFISSGSEEFVQTFQSNYNLDECADEAAIFSKNNLGFIPAECREDPSVLNEVKGNKELSIIDLDDIRGVVHNHSTWSDGSNSIAEMADRCQELGYEYLVMSDHSKAAFYASGLKEDQVFGQFEEIDALNEKISDFRIFKSIECDILSDGSLDYGDEFLSNFELVIASVHSNLNMDQPKAMKRLLAAIRNKHTRILGHPTGRLLLSRKGYPIDHKEVIDACSEHNVVIELNASPYRLDMDWQWIPYAVEKGVMISINPDAHSVKGIDDIAHGVTTARKACLKPEACLNTKTLSEFEAWVSNGRGS